MRPGFGDLTRQDGAVGHRIDRDGGQLARQLIHAQLLGESQSHLALSIAMQLQFSADTHTDFKRGFAQQRFHHH
ncbi:hypothetical protein D3C81_1906350 [compost metagenome]